MLFSGYRVSEKSWVRDPQGRVGKVDAIRERGPIDGRPAAYIIGSNPHGGQFAAWVSVSALRPVKQTAATAVAITAI